MRTGILAVMLATAFLPALGQEVGGIPTQWPGGFVRLVYEVSLPEETAYTMTVELVPQTNGTYYVRTETVGEGKEASPALLPSFFMWTPWIWLTGSLLGVDFPVAPGHTYELGSYELGTSMEEAPLPAETVSVQLVITEETFVLAGVRAVGARLIYKTQEEETQTWLALPMEPMLPYPVWVRAKDKDSDSNNWLEIKLVSYVLCSTD